MDVITVFFETEVFVRNSPRDSKTSAAWERVRIGS
jgi:hypothetical protein